jgi:GntR family transcriptional regulator/MocR family aminotransferase
LLPEGLSESVIVDAARRREIALTGLAPFWHGPAAAQGIVLGYGTPPERDYPRALEDLGRLLRDTTTS